MKGTITADELLASIRSELAGKENQIPKRQELDQQVQTSRRLHSNYYFLDFPFFSTDDRRMLFRSYIIIHLWLPSFFFQQPCPSLFSATFTLFSLTRSTTCSASMIQIVILLSAHHPFKEKRNLISLQYLPLHLIPPWIFHP